MPRKAKGARLYERKRKGRQPTWVIRDTGGIEIATRARSRSEAEGELAQYINSRDRPRGPAQTDQITISQVLAIYIEEHLPTIAAPERQLYAIDALDQFWANLSVAAIKGPTCRRYAQQRNRSLATVRRELGVLRAALKYCAKEGYLLAAPEVPLPPKGRRRERYLTRTEVARLLRAARSLRIDGRQQLVRFILAAIYTGSRKQTVLSLRIDQESTDGGWIDTENGILYREAKDSTQTVKRKGTARAPRQLLAHVRRWKANGARFVVEDHEGNRIGDIRKGFDNAVRIAKLGREVTPHVLKHTAITWAIQRGARLQDVASYFSTSIETIEKNYWHHSPYHQESAVRAMESRGIPTEISR